jgi:hypothetical protein
MCPDAYVVKDTGDNILIEVFSIGVEEIAVLNNAANVIEVFLVIFSKSCAIGRQQLFYRHRDVWDDVNIL